MLDIFITRGGSILIWQKECRLSQGSELERHQGAACKKLHSAHTGFKFFLRELQENFKGCALPYTSTVPIY